MDTEFEDLAFEEEDDDYQFIYGVKSWDDLIPSPACRYTMNDFEIGYDKRTGKYLLGIETAYMFDSPQDEIKYYNRLLQIFSDYMDVNKLHKYIGFHMWMQKPEVMDSANTIEELYANFKVFVLGFTAYWEDWLSRYGG